MLARALFRAGYDAPLSGHITHRDGDTLLMTPFGIGWDEMCASDIARVDLDGNHLEGPWVVSPAGIVFHLELHHARPDTRWLVHNHPEWTAVWAGARRLPPVYDQTGAGFPGIVRLVDEYETAFVEQAESRRVVEQIGDADVALLANHGLVVAGTDLGEVVHHAIAFEWRCRLAARIGTGDEGRAALPETAVAELHRAITAGRARWPFIVSGLFESLARREIRADAGVLR